MADSDTDSSDSGQYFPSGSETDIGSTASVHSTEYELEEQGDSDDSRRIDFEVFFEESDSSDSHSDSVLNTENVDAEDVDVDDEENNSGPEEVPVFNVTSSESDDSDSESTFIDSESNEEDEPAEERNSTSEIVPPPNANVDDGESIPTEEVKTHGEKRSFDDSIADDGATCSICLDQFTNSGPHRLSSLSCGHLFGHKCVEYWLKVGCSASSRRCPTCNKKALLRDIRILYAKKLVALDTSELDQMKEELEKTAIDRNKLEIEISIMKMKENKLKQEVTTLRKELETVLKYKAENGNEKEESGSYRLKLFKVVDVTSTGGCRVLATDGSMNLVVSTHQKNNLFPDYGLKKFDATTFSKTQVIPLHSKMIRDVAFHREDKNLLLSVSLDATAKVLDIRSNTGLNTFTNDNIPLWSCCWDHGSPYLLYVGGQTGTIMQYDTRNINEAVKVSSGVGNITAVVSLSVVPGLKNPSAPQAGLLSCRLNSILAHEQDSASEFSAPIALPIAGGPFMSMSYNESNNLILTSVRPSSKFPFTRLALNQFSTNINSCNLIHTIHGSRTSTVMSRSCFVNPPASKTGCVAAFNECSSKIEMFDIGSAQLVSNVAVKEKIIDICPIYGKGSLMLTALTDKQLMVFTCVSSDNTV